MAEQSFIEPLLLGILEGLTEFIPVSSTGHLVLAREFLDFNDPTNSFIVLIQLGAILAIITVYFAKLFGLVIKALHGDKSAWIFFTGILLATFPAVLIGVLTSDQIDLLLQTPILICVTLIVGGVILLWIDQLRLEPKYTDIAQFPPSLCFKIGIFQMLALIPGVSRSGATIVGALLLGTDKRSATEFTFFMALPIMVGAFGFKLLKSGAALNANDGLSIAIGFAAAFVSAAIVVKFLLDFVSRYGFLPFAIWRILVGSAGLVGLMLIG